MIMKTSIPCLSFLLATAIIAPAQTEGTSEPARAGQSPMVSQLEPLKDKSFDAGFLKMMIAHHQSGIEMAELAQTRASNNELKEFAGDMVKSHKQELEKLNAWLKSWDLGDIGPKAEAAGMQEKHQQHLKHLQGLKGEEFDKAFLSVMIPHHREGLAMLDLVEQRSERKALEEFAQTSLKEQRQEIQKLQKFQKDAGSSETSRPD